MLHLQTSQGPLQSMEELQRVPQFLNSEWGSKASGPKYQLLILPFIHVIALAMTYGTVWLGIISRLGAKGLAAAKALRITGRILRPAKSRPAQGIESASLLVTDIEFKNMTVSLGIFKCLQWVHKNTALALWRTIVIWATFAGPLFLQVQFEFVQILIF